MEETQLALGLVPTGVQIFVAHVLWSVILEGPNGTSF